MPLTDKERAERERLLKAHGRRGRFRDPDFPHTKKSLALEGREDVAKWKRPGEIAKKPRPSTAGASTSVVRQTSRLDCGLFAAATSWASNHSRQKPSLFVDGASYSDVEQGYLGDCWFLASATAVAQYPDLIRQVIPDDQPLYGKDYRGILVFRFWRMGHWTSVYIDDKLPVDEDDNLVYGRCTTENEFWLPLLEKAFAKFHGNYENIVAGFPSEAFLPLTGYIVEDSYLANFGVPDLYRLFSVELKNNSVIACSTGSNTKMGLVSDHAYTVTGVDTLRLGSSLVRLVRVRNPHASTEWKGAWGDSDPNWDEVDGKKLAKLEFENIDDGQFWMKMSDFKKHLPYVYLAARLPDFGDDCASTTLKSDSVCDYWKKGVNAGGGNIKDPEKFLRNPQYTLIIHQTNDPESQADKEDNGDKQTCGVVLQLIQEQDRAKYKNLNKIGITIFKFPPMFVGEYFQRGLKHEWQLLDSVQPHEGSVQHVDFSCVVSRLHLTPGAYLVVPSTEEPDVSRNFLLRVYSRKPFTFSNRK